MTLCIRHVAFKCELLLIAGLLASAFAHAQGQPVAPQHPVVTDYFSTTVVDNYRYMEDLANADVQAWMRAQADYTRARLDAIPGRKPLLDRIHALLDADLFRYGFVRRGERYFYEVFEPGAQFPKLYYRNGLRGADHLLLDPGTLVKGSGTHYTLDFFEPSWDGRLLAYGISAGGSENSVLHVMDVATGAVQAEAIDRTSDSVVSWRPDSRSFFYLRYPKPVPGMPANQTHYNARTYLHAVGSKADGDTDPVVFGRGVSSRLEVPEGQGTYVLVAPGSRYAVAVANHNMDSNPATVYVAPLAQVAGAATPWKKVVVVADGVTHVLLHGDILYLLSQHNAPRFRLLALPLARPALANATVVIPEGAGVLTDVQVAQDGLYARERDGAVSHLHRVSFDGRDTRPVVTPFEGNIGVPVTDPNKPGALYGIRGWLQSTRVMAYDATADRSDDTGLNPPPSVDRSGYEAEEVFVISYDGTRIPLSIVHRKGLALDGSHPTLLDGYGSYGDSQEPGMSPSDLAWLELGGVIAIAHVRGGGEYGEDWHLGGYKLTKLNTVQDFIACAQYLVDRHYTSPPRLAGEGVSAGGITVGGARTRRPDIFGVILDSVGMSDTLRFETEPNGPPNVVEFGSTKTETGFHGLYAMSAYAHVRDGVAYPAVLFSTGANDPRVSPWHMAKMAARVQAATSSKRPVLLRVEYDAGHGSGSSNDQYESELADLWSFCLWQMGYPEFQPAVK